MNVNVSITDDMLFYTPQAISTKKFLEMRRAIRYVRMVLLAYERVHLAELYTLLSYENFPAWAVNGADRALLERGALSWSEKNVLALVARDSEAPSKDSNRAIARFKRTRAKLREAERACMRRRAALRSAFDDLFLKTR